MAEIAGLSLAANVFQILEYGVKFTSMAWKIYMSGTNTLDRFRDLQKLSSDLDLVTQRLERRVPSPSWQHSDDNDTSDQALLAITEECRAASREMLTSLIDIGLLPSRKPRKRDALRTAFKLRWNEENIRALTTRLEGCRSQLILFLMASLRYVL